MSADRLGSRSPEPGSRKAPAAARLAICAALLLLALATPRPPTPSQASGGPPGDGMAFKRVVDDMRAGRPYYAAMGDMLQRSGYPATSVFNWRTPLLYELLWALPSWTAARVTLTALAAIASAAVCVVAAGVSPLAGAMAGVAALGVVVMMSAPAAVSMGEAWAGCLIALSVCAFTRRRGTAGICLALAALALRELAAPYCLACAAIAAYRRRWREVAGWSAGGLAYLTAYWFHANAVAAHQLPEHLRQTTSWVAWGGLPFLLSTLRWHGLFLLLPWHWTALALVLVAAGVIWPRAPAHLRASAGLYAVLFLAVGQPFNEYWGFLAWPSWCLAAGLGLQALLEDGLEIAGRRGAPGG
jgi:hypothetical protein